VICFDIGQRGYKSPLCPEIGYNFVLGFAMSG
jgi:hypothetical protein